MERKGNEKEERKWFKEGSGRRGRKGRGWKEKRRERRMGRED